MKIARQILNGKRENVNMKGICKITCIKGDKKSDAQSRIKITFNKSKDVYLKFIFKLTGERISP